MPRVEAQVLPGGFDEALHRERTRRANIDLREVRNRVIEEVRKVLLSNHFTVRSNVSTNISVIYDGSPSGSA